MELFMFQQSLSASTVKCDEQEYDPGFVSVELCPCTRGFHPLGCRSRIVARFDDESVYCSSEFSAVPQIPDRSRARPPAVRRTGIEHLIVIPCEFLRWSGTTTGINHADWTISEGPKQVQIARSEPVSG